jgi:hypothetical protein
MSTDQPAPPGIDTSVPHSARRYDYWLGGKDNFAADRASGDAIEAIYPHVRTSARQNRAFLGRAVRYAVDNLGLRQFLDIGTGLPTADNTHEVAQRIAPDARIVYVDNDPLVLVHARALLTSTPEGATAYLDADLRHPETIIGNKNLTATLDLNQPIVLILSHGTADFTPAIAREFDDADFKGRSHQQITGLLPPGWTALDPGLTVLTQWHPELGAPGGISLDVPDEQVAFYGVMLRKNSATAGGPA